MESRVAILAILVENVSAAAKIQELLSEYSSYIIGRMGIPYQPKDLRIISVALDAPIDTINALTGKIGRLSGVTAKTVCSNV